MTHVRTVIIIAKAPVPGRVKTRMCPPLSPRQAAALAEASLRDTLAAVRGVANTRCVIALDGEPGSWMPDDIEVVAQCRGGLDERIAGAFAEGDRRPTVLVGMDTPQLEPTDVVTAFELLDGADSVLGPATDGGYWLLGLRTPDPRAVLGVPMSVAHTARSQRDQLDVLGLTIATLRELRDVDHYDDARAVARTVPSSRFAAAFRTVDESLADAR